jgi:hypothetical protein
MVNKSTLKLPRFIAVISLVIGRDNLKLISLDRISDSLNTLKHGKEVDSTIAWREWEKSHQVVSPSNLGEFFAFVSKRHFKRGQ